MQTDEGFQLFERLPWIFYLVACCFLVLFIAYVSTLSFEMNIVLRILHFLIAAFIPLSITAGFLIEAFKPSWKERKIAWWVYVAIIASIVVYALISYELDHNLIYGDDLDTMLMLAGVLVVPCFASIFALLKAPDINNRTIYGLFAYGYFSMAFIAIIAVCTRGR